jgi:hypothetical protein
MKKYLYILLGLLFTFSTQAQVVEKIKSNLRPDHSKVHFAGEIGFLSASYGKKIWNKENLEFDAFIGFAPRNVAGDDITTLAVKGTYFPYNLKLSENGYTVEPIGVGLNLYHAFGNNLNKYRDTGLYKKGYYWWTIGLRIAPFITGRINKEFESKHFKRIGLYYELGTNDLYFFSWFDNRETFPVHKIFNFSIGMVVFFNE